MAHGTQERRGEGESDSGDRSDRGYGRGPLTELPTASPNALGLDASRLHVADTHAQAGVDDATYPAAVLVVARHGAIAHRAAFGECGGSPTAPETIFDLASLTKPIVAVALLTLVEEGRALLSQTIEELLPESAGTEIAARTVRHLATHTSGLPPWRPLYEAGEGAETLLAEILRTPPEHPPGTRYAYSDLGYLLLGEIVARVGGMPLDRLLRARLFAPLGMEETGYRPDAAQRRRIAPTAHCPYRPGRTLIGEVHDANAAAFGGVAGHAGLFGTASDLARLATALLGDRKEDPRLLGLPTLQLAQTNQIPPEVGGHSIGWFTAPNPMLPRGDLLSDRAFGHTGFTGTMVVCDPAYDLVVVFLTNRVMNPADNGGMQRTRRRVLNAVASAIVE